MAGSSWWFIFEWMDEDDNDASPLVDVGVTADDDLTSQLLPNDGLSKLASGENILEVDNRRNVTKELKIS